MAYSGYIINDEVIFKVNDNVLESLSHSGEKVLLNSPTARCLQLLLESENEIVSRDEFLETVWKTRGIVVSQNTFYQNISLLRKSLKSAGLTNDIITTVRRKGFILSSDASVSPVCDSHLINTEGTFNSDSINRPLAPEKIAIFRDNIVENSGNAKHAIVLRVPVWCVVLISLLVVLEVISLLIRYLS